MGSDAVADWPLLECLSEHSRRRELVSIHNGGGVESATRFTPDKSPSPMERT